MDKRILTLMHINICGLDELNHYVRVKGPDVVFWNETKVRLPQHLLNYKAVSEHKHGLGGVAILLKDGISYTRLLFQQPIYNHKT